MILASRRPARLRRVVLLVLVGLLATPTIGQADSIDFTALTRGAASLIQIGGLTISGEDGARVAIENGVGLGMADGVGRAGSFDEVWHYLANTGAGEGELSLTVDGYINALTIQPYLVIDGPTPTDGVPLYFQVAFGPVAYDLVFPSRRFFNVNTPFETRTFNSSDFAGGAASNSIFGLRHIGVEFDFSKGDVFAPYLRSQNFPDVSFSYGFSIVSMDYTPRHVPEPSSVLLVTIGLVGIGLLRRRVRRSH